MLFKVFQGFSKFSSDIWGHIRIFENIFENFRDFFRDLLEFFVALHNWFRLLHKFFWKISKSFGVYFVHLSEILWPLVFYSSLFKIFRKLFDILRFFSSFFKIIQYLLRFSGAFRTLFRTFREFSALFGVSFKYLISKFFGQFSRFFSRISAVCCTFCFVYSRFLCLIRVCFRFFEISGLFRFFSVSFGICGIVSKSIDILKGVSVTFRVL